VNNNKPRMPGRRKFARKKTGKYTCSKSKNRNRTTKKAFLMGRGQKKNPFQSQGPATPDVVFFWGCEKNQHPPWVKPPMFFLGPPKKKGPGSWGGANGKPPPGTQSRKKKKEKFKMSKKNLTTPFGKKWGGKPHFCGLPLHVKTRFFGGGGVPGRQ